MMSASSFDAIVAPTNDVIVAAGMPVQTLYDWITLAMLSALAILFLQRSLGPAAAGDRVVLYLPPAAGCAAADLAGNGGQHAAAAAIIVATLGYAAWVLRPWPRPR